MADSPHPDGKDALTPDFLTHLEQAFGWSEEQALAALGGFVMSSEAGRALDRELMSGNQAPCAA